MLFQPKIYKQHERRGYDKKCPHCGRPIVWLTDGVYWYPCDKEPVLFTIHPDGHASYLYKRKLLTHCIRYRPGDKRIEKQPLMGHEQHYYTCPVLRQRRKVYMEEKKYGIIQ